MRRLMILAAGRGTRLAPLTDDRPKCMVELEGRPLLEWQLLAARQCGVQDITLVLGYRAERIQFPGVRTVLNPRYASTNMVYSLWCAREYFGSGFVLAYGDILYNTNVLEAVFASKHPIAVAVDNQWQPYWERRFEDVLQDAESLRLDGRGCIMDIGRKVKTKNEIQGQYMGLVGFRGAAVHSLKQVLADEEAAFRRGDRKIHRDRNFGELYMTDLLQALIDGGTSVHAVQIQGGWLEIDNHRDLALATTLVQVGEGQLVIQR